MHETHDLKSLALLLLFFCLHIPAWAQQDLARPADPVGVTDPAGLISDSISTPLTKDLRQFADEKKAQIAVVVVKTIGEQNPKEFATALFERWALGEKKTDNGLLVLLVMDQRRVEFETGYGLEGILTDLECYKIQQELMVPAFLAGNYGLGVDQGVRRVMQHVEKLLPPPQELTEEQPWIKKDKDTSWFFFILMIAFILVFGLGILACIIYAGFVVIVPFLALMDYIAPTKVALKESENPKRYSFHKTTEWAVYGICLLVLVLPASFIYTDRVMPTSNPLITFYVFAAAFAGFAHVLIRILVLRAGTAQAKYNTVIGNPLKIFRSLIYPLPLLPFLALDFLYLGFLRRRQKTCPDCGKARKKLEGEARIALLGAKENTEERLGTVRYDVWECDHGQDIFRAFSYFSRFEQCPHCDAVAMKKDYNAKPVQKGMHVLRCEACQQTEERYPVRYNFSSSGSGGGRSGGGSGRSGGGRSGGGGAGSSW